MGQVIPVPLPGSACVRKLAACNFEMLLNSQNKKRGTEMSLNLSG